MAARAAYLLARDALLPWRSVRKNVKLPLDIRGQLSADRHHEITADLIKQVGLAGYENHAIKQLSHGMRPRVSLARILTGGFLAAQAMAARPRPAGSLRHPGRDRGQRLLPDRAGRGLHHRAGGERKRRRVHVMPPEALLRTRFVELRAHR